MQPAAHINALANFASGLRYVDLTQDVAERVRWILADCVGCIVAGNRMAEVIAFALLRGASRSGGTSLLGTAFGTTPEAASLLNGMAGTWHDLDEGNLHTKGHAGIQIVPALLAEAETRGSSGEALLAALAAGYEVGCRVYGATTARLAVHPHGTFGPLAAAVAVARLRELPAPRMANVIRLAAGLGVVASRGTLSGGATIRNTYTGISGMSAFLALDLEQAGLTGEVDPFATVFGQIYGTEFDPALSTGGLGSSWRLMQNYFKTHPSARYAHSALDLLDEIVAAHGPIPPAEIAAIEMETYLFAATLAGQSVSTAFGTRFSIPFLLAARLLGAEEALDGDGSRVLDRADVHALARLVRVRENSSYTMDYPTHQRSKMTITLRDGTVLRAAAEFIRGEAERPHGEAAMRAKFLALTQPSWGQHAPAALTELLAIEATSDARVWIAAARQATR